MSIFKEMICIEYAQDVFRNIRTVNPPQDLFDDLSDDPLNWEAANIIDICTHPRLEISGYIQRGFDYSINNFIQYPFENIKASRFSDGSFACWYGSEKFETTLHETTYHFKRDILDEWDIHQTQKKIVADRCVAKVNCTGIALDLSDKIREFPWLIDSNDYTQCQSVGKKIMEEGFSLLKIASARHLGGINVAALQQRLLSNPLVFCQLQYIFDVHTQEITIKRDKKILKLPAF